MKPEMQIETCLLCGDATGRAGRLDDSLYPIIAIKLPTISKREIGDEIGPLCENCYDCLNIIGAITKDD